MLTFLKLGHKGNLGNQLFQIASTMGLAKQYGHDFIFPKWHYSKYFDFNFNDNLSHDDWMILNEEKFNFYEWNISKENFSINGWLQTELYFKNIDIKSVFKFNEQFEKQVLFKREELYSKPTILISVRRGDFVNSEGYFQLSYKYYFTALINHFPDFNNYNIIFTSDDINYCKYHFSFLENVFFLEGLNAVEQLAIATKFDHYIISNSTFSWWLARLGENEKTKVICPVKNFKGSYASKYDEKDYFPKRWIRHNEKEFKIPLKYYKLFFKGELFKYNHTLINFFKNKVRKTKKKIKKIIQNI
ncbi:alpha-1,2-fucosyltransferase [Flavobacterium ardleyense]|uniref:Alpha-1,2-fucosyltransferase n=1 Tax=Flavobacterium ardleyense TaxID=2038737 RepID=A0ABW5ZAW0_9FLAO